MLVRRGDGEGVVGRPTLFLSHAWRYKFADLVDALDEHLAGLSVADRVVARVWNDVFVEDQNSSDAKPEAYFFTAFKDAVTGAGLEGAVGFREKRRRAGGESGRALR